MWQEYFPLGKIYSMDINEELETDRGKVYKGDQTNKDDLCRMVKIIGNCDVIIDDGSHIPQHQIDTFNYLFENMLNNGGTYIIEDIECTYWNPKNIMYGYEVGNSSIIDNFQSLPHKINSEFSNLKNHQLISSVTYFKNCIILGLIPANFRVFFKPGHLPFSIMSGVLLNGLYDCLLCLMPFKIRLPLLITYRL